MTTKTCSKCLTELPLDSFSPQRNVCIECRRTYHREYARTWQQNNLDRYRASQRKTKYGITPNDFDSMLSDQKGRCAICQTETPGGKGTWHVDHCHTTQRVRGLLCTHCNLGIGHLRDDIAILKRAILYLENHQ